MNALLIPHRLVSQVVHRAVEECVAALLHQHLGPALAEEGLAVEGGVVGGLARATAAVGRGGRGGRGGGGAADQGLAWKGRKKEGGD